MILTVLTTIPKNGATPISTLTVEQLTELQTALVKLGYPAGDIDGKYGHNTRNAWAEFMDDNAQKNSPDSIDANSLNTLQQVLDNNADSNLTYNFSTKDGAIAAIKNECNRQGIGLDAQIAYVLATADHETNHTFKPVREAYWLANPDAYLKRHHPDYYPYYGRGYVQLTWDYNYKKYGTLLDKDLLGNPDLALQPEIALFVLVHGFKTGAFTGRKITDYINEHTTDFINARRCINGIDKVQEIAALANQYLDSQPKVVGTPVVKLAVTASALNLRDTPSTDGNVITTLEKGDVVEGIEASGDGRWQRVTHGAYTGWASFKYLQPAMAEAPIAAFLWFDIAKQELGISEVAGTGDNSRIVEYLRSTTLGGNMASNDETAWCSAFVNFCVEKAGFAGTDSAMARSWLKWGRSTETPVVGCIVVFERGAPPSGHVAFYVSESGGNIKVLGGNQGDKVCYKEYPKNRCLGYRVPR